MNALWYGISWQKLQTFSQEALVSYASGLRSSLSLSLSVCPQANKPCDGSSKSHNYKADS